MEEAVRVDLSRYDSRDWRDTPALYKVLWTSIRHPHAALCNVRVKGRENVPRDGGVILASNHFSWWDPILTMNVMPRHVAWLAKRELYGGRFSDWFFANVGCIPVDRKAGSNIAAIEAALTALDRERVVGVYPEGTRSRPGALLPPRRGVARLAIASGAAVLPVGVASDRFWGMGMKAPNFGEPVHIRFGEPIRYDYAPEDAHDREVTAKVAEDVMDRIRRLLDECFEAREKGLEWE